MASKRKNPTQKQTPEDARLEELDRELDRQKYTGSPKTKYRWVNGKRRLTSEELGRTI